MKGLPSRFATGNFALAALIFMIIGIPFYVMGIVVFLAYIIGPVAFMTALKLYQSRAKRHKILKPLSFGEFAYKVTTTLDRLQSEMDDCPYRVRCSYTTTAGGD
jgi:hypothetical protein